MGTVVLDTNVLIGAFDPADEMHALARRELTPWLGPEHDRLVPTIVYAELMVRPAEAGIERATDESLRRLAVRFVDLSLAIARRTAKIRARFGAVTLGDAVVLATALEHGAQLLTFDAGMELAWERLP